MKKRLLLLVSAMILLVFGIKAQMILKYDTGLSSGNTVVLPLYGIVNVTVDWGDGNSQVVTSQGNVSHDYSSEGTYTVTITGNDGTNSLTHYTDYQCDNSKLTEVVQWGI